MGNVYDTFDVRSQALSAALSYVADSSNIYDAKGAVEVAEIFYTFLTQEMKLLKEDNNATSTQESGA
jgi:hypothetical protein